MISFFLSPRTSKNLPSSAFPLRRPQRVFFCSSKEAFESTCWKIVFCIQHRTLLASNLVAARFALEHLLMARNGKTKANTEENWYLVTFARAGAYTAVAINSAVHMHGLVAHRIARCVLLQWFILYTFASTGAINLETSADLLLWTLPITNFAATWCSQTCSATICAAKHRCLNRVRPQHWRQHLRLMFSYVI